MEVSITKVIDYVDALPRDKTKSKLYADHLAVGVLLSALA
jgi:hypothetical protein